MKHLIFLLLLVLSFSCCGKQTNHPTYKDPGNNGKPTSDFGFIEIANNPDANSYQLHTVRLMMDFVEEIDPEIAYNKLLELDALLLDFDSLRFVYYQNKSEKKYCGGSIEINNYIQDVSPIQEFANITTLNLSDNKIKNIEPLTQLTNLKVLKINHNQLSDITPLSSLVNLEELELFDNHIKDFSPIVNLTNLKRLHLGKNNSDDFTVLQPLVDKGLIISTESLSRY